jgi:hypothetical protein
MKIFLSTSSLVVVICVSIVNTIPTPEDTNNVRDYVSPTAGLIGSGRSNILMEIDPHHPRYGTVRNFNIPLPYDCALRAVTVEMASYIQPNVSRSNWTALSESALQMNECNGQSYRVHKSSNTQKPFEAMQTTKKNNCFRTIFVQDAVSDDLFDGTLHRPLKTIPAALSLTRGLRAVHGNKSTLYTVHYYTWRHLLSRNKCDQSKQSNWCYFFDK